MNLQKPYDRNSFQSFLKGFLPDCVFDIRRVEANGLQATKEAIYLGHSPLLDLQVFEITHLSSSDARIALATDGFKVMKDSATYRALVAYRLANSDSWRLSLMTATPAVDEKGKVKQFLSNPRRFSFSLGPDAKIHTPEESLIKQGRVKDFEDLKNRFSIEVVNKEFYTQIAVLFTQLAGGKREIGRKSIDAGSGSLKLPSTNDDTLHKEFAVRLIGRLVFCWFLKKKRSERKVPLLPDEILSSAAVTKHKGFYHDVLEPLFFEVLNTPTTKREKKFADNPWALIPFLNGGLFTAHLHDFYELGPLGASKCLNTLIVPDKWIKDLFDVFETFNFTIDENTTVDVELSIEPEMLGRIFENLLAEINPETGETARKATGSYYTPRAIVDYMVDESIRQYLLDKTNLDKMKINSLLSYEVTETLLSDSEKEKVIDALDTIKVIDPACGSGAFPMGVLQKMLLILQKVDPESQLWLDRKLVNIPDASLRKELKAKLKTDNFNYIHKLGIIRDAIYGVDIQPIAMEISKLRFFLSLIVDEAVNDSKENRGVEPLPNLEFKFVCANSLIGLPKHDSQQSFSEAAEEIMILKNLRDEYLGSYGPEKKRIQKKFLDAQSKMSKHAMSWALWGSDKSQTMKLSQWDPFSEEPCDWFDPEWMFDIKNGFDIVIANPPYGADLTDAHKTILKNEYAEIVERIRNSFLYFLGLAHNLANKNGIVSFIIPSEFLFQIYMSKARKYFLVNSEILYAINVGEDVFEAIVPTCLIAMKKRLNKNCNILMADFRHLTLSQLAENLDSKKLSSISSSIILNSPNHIFMFDVDRSALINRLSNNYEKFEIVCDDIANGISTSCDKVYIVSKAFAREHGFEKKYLKTCIRGGQFNRYYCPQDTGDFVLYITDDFDESEAPAITKYLLKNRELLIKKCVEKKGGNRRWNVLFRSRYQTLFAQPKIIIRQTADRIVATIDEATGYYCIDSVNVALPKREYQDKLRYYIGLLNSSLLNFFYREISQEAGRVLAQVKPQRIRMLPITPKPSKNDEAMITSLVKKIIDSKTVNPEADTQDFERKIDTLVYKLYDLNNEEIRIVDEQRIKYNIK